MRRWSPARGAVLAAPQRLRGISLHPDPEAEMADGTFIAASALLQGVFAALDSIAERGERALVFLDDLEMQARLVGLIQRRYRLATPADGHQRAGQRCDASGAGGPVPSRIGRLRRHDPVAARRWGRSDFDTRQPRHSLTRWWNPAVEDQCTGRILRIGQTRPVYVHIPMAVLGKDCSAFDRNLNALVTRKRRLC